MAGLCKISIFDNFLFFHFLFPFSELPHYVVEELCMCLNPPLMRKDYRSLAGKMGFTHKQVKNIDTKSNPTEELLAIWASGKGSKNVTDLIELLTAIKRYDAIEMLKEHEYNSKPSHYLFLITQVIFIKI